MHTNPNSRNQKLASLRMTAKEPTTKAIINTKIEALKTAFSDNTPSATIREGAFVRK